MGCRPPGAVLVRSAAEQRLDGQIAFPGFPVPHCPAALTYQERTGWPAGFAPVGKMTCMKNGDWLRPAPRARAWCLTAVLFHSAYYYNARLTQRGDDQARGTKRTWAGRLATIRVGHTHDLLATRADKHPRIGGPAKKV